MPTVLIPFLSPTQLAGADVAWTPIGGTLAAVLLDASDATYLYASGPGGSYSRRISASTTPTVIPTGSAIARACPIFNVASAGFDCRFIATINGAEAFVDSPNTDPLVIGPGFDSGNWGSVTVGQLAAGLSVELRAFDIEGLGLEAYLYNLLYLRVDYTVESGSAARIAMMIDD